METLEIETIYRNLFVTFLKVVFALNEPLNYAFTCIYLCLEMFILCIWLDNIWYNNCEGYKIHSKKVSRKMIFIFLYLVDFCLH
jgi:hypothetical protein